MRNGSTHRELLVPVLAFKSLLRAKREVNKLAEEIWNVAHEDVDVGGHLGIRIDPQIKLTELIYELCHL